jgi:acetoin utilization protein AcuB
MASPATSLETHELRYLLDALTVDEIMTRAVITVGPGFPIEEAARLIVKEKVGALPVTEQGRLVGIVTETDVLELFVKGMGAAEPSSRIDVQLLDGHRTLADLVHAVEEAPAEISSIMTLADRSGHKDVIIRVRSIDPRPIVARLVARGYSVRDPRKG